jgi:hypothetical protein
MKVIFSSSIASLEVPRLRPIVISTTLVDVLRHLAARQQEGAAIVLTEIQWGLGSRTPLFTNNSVHEQIFRAKKRLG